MLNPCRPCCCPEAPCEQCSFGYRTKEENHKSMKKLFAAVDAGEKPYGWRVVEFYRFLHPDWQAELQEE